MFLPFLLSFLSVIVLMPFGLRLFKRFQFRQTVRELGPKNHQTKTGTPTFGGVIFMLPFFIFPFFVDKMNSEFKFVFISTLLFTLIGFADDLLKVLRRTNLGLTSKQKFICQLLAALVSFLYFRDLNLSTSVDLYFVDKTIDFGWLYPLFFALFFIGTTNASNLTDGLDGLLSGLALPILFTFTLMSHQSGLTDMTTLNMILIGSLIAFLIFNFNPARIFMGDTGSLGLGAFIASMAVLTKTEFLLILLAGVLVIETLSVIMQVVHFKRTGKRLFKMTPIHHSFEVSGWKEKEIVVSFWFTGIIFASVSYLLYIL